MGLLMKKNSDTVCEPTETHINEERTEPFSIKSGDLEHIEVLRLILDNMVDGVIVTDENGKFIVFNKRAEQIAGKGQTDSQMRMWPDHFGIFKPDKTTLCPPEELPLPRALNGETIVQEEAWICNEAIPEGVWVSISATPVKDASGKIIGSVGVFRDIGEQKRAAEAIRRYAENLTLSHEELQNLAFAVSHELQAPLSTVTSYLNLISIRYKDRLGKDADEFIDKVVGSSKIIERMLDDLWTYARVERKDSDTREISCTGLVDDLIQELRNKITTSGARVSREIMPIIRGNKSQIHYLFKSLLDNAIDFRKPGDVPTIHFSVEESDTHWIFSVKDNGRGIKSENYNDIFKLFNRINEKPHGVSTGMGLAIARKIVEHHGGKIWVNSEVDDGSTFYFTLAKTA